MKLTKVLLFMVFRQPKTFSTNLTFRNSSGTKIKAIDKEESIKKDTNVKMKTKTFELPKDEDDYVVVYTDGACSNNGKPNAKAGIGVWFADNFALNVSKPVKGRPTSNTAEIQACLTALRIVKKHEVERVKIVTDSQFVVNAMTKWIETWKSSKWKNSTGKEVKNKSDFIKLHNAAKKLQDVRWEHVEGHIGIKGNEEANKLAIVGALKYVPTVSSGVNENN